MLGIIVSAFILIFGIFLKVTKDPGFIRNKKLAWFFIIVGIVVLVYKILNYK
jgi:hypothetical protein